MKMDLAVYTAQEGYSWQPGTALTAEDLGKFKKAIGRFPSADAADFPFGGVLKVDGRVVFYRYHVAKKIDFCGRDALYCVLGAVPFADAAKIDPATLFALPEFAGPMKPFPTSLELPEADPSAVPEWLKNLDKMTLDVRIAGPAEKPRYAVTQELQAVPTPPEPPSEPSPASNPKPDVPPPAPASATEPASPEPELQAEPEPPPPKKMPYWMLAGIAALALLIMALSALAVWFCLKRHADSQEDQPMEPPAQTNVVQTSTNDPSVAANPAPVVTNAPSAVTNPVPAQVTIVAPTNAPAAIVQQPAAPTANAEPEAVAPTNTPASVTKPPVTPAQPTKSKATSAPATKPPVTPAQPTKSKAASAPATKPPVTPAQPTKSKAASAPATKPKATPAPQAGKPAQKNKGK